MSLDYRLAHVLGIISLALLLPTGSSEHGRGSLLAFHIDFGLASLAALAAYSAFLFSRHKVRLFDALKHPVSSQIREGFAVARKYLFGTPYPTEVKSGFARYNVLASYASLMLVLSFFPLLLGGIAMVFLQRGTLLFEEMKALHLLGVGLITLFFLAHVFAVFQAENRPLLKAMVFNGRVHMEWAKEYLPQYIKKFVYPPEE